MDLMDMVLLQEEAFLPQECILLLLVTIMGILNLLLTLHPKEYQHNQCILVHILLTQEHQHQECHKHPHILLMHQ